VSASPASAHVWLSPPAESGIALPPPAITGIVVAVSLTAMILIGYVGSAGTIVFVASWTLLAIAYGRATVHLLASGPKFLWLFPALALLSTVWSRAPIETLRFALELVVTVGCTVLAARLLRPTQLLIALTVALVATAAVSVLLGREMVDPLTGQTVFEGVFTSKNQLGFFASLMLLAALSLTIDARQPLPARLLGVGAGLLSLPLVYLSRSATSLASVTLAAAVLVLGLLLSRHGRFGRARILCAGLIMLVLVAIPILAAGSEVGALFLRILGKNTTLSGRTMLWQYAAAVIAQRPVFGTGFQAFWLHDSVDAESLWRWFHVESRTGFHFHNTFIEATVELGYPGAVLLAVTMLAILVGTIGWSWREGSVAAAFFVAVLCCLLVRAMAEVDALQQFQIGTFILYAAGTYAAMKPRDGPR
jgi:exopolysaccharide production protein ExoQ